MSLPLSQVLVGCYTCLHKDDSLFSLHILQSIQLRTAHTAILISLLKVRPVIHIFKTTKEVAKSALYCLFLCIVTSSAQAIILYSGDNSANLTAPDAARDAAFNSIAKITNSDGTGIVGSAVHLKDKYLLTAGHVLYKDDTPRRSHVTFDGTTYWAIDLNFFPIQIGTADLVIFKLVQNPNLPETVLYSSTNERFKTGTLIGWGYGRDTNQANQTGSSRTWSWGDETTIAKRWGTNRVELTGNANIGGNTYNYLQTRLDSSQGNNEAAFAYYDSGSGLFISNSGSWELAGITTAVSTSNSSKFAQSFNSPDLNYFVRVSQYRQAILNNIPNTSTFQGWAIDNSLYGTDAETTADPDSDGLENQTEFNFNTNPNLSDTDSDGLNDGLEVNNHMTDPLDADSDDDGLNDGDEINTHNSDPNDTDSDDDSLLDMEEVNTYGTNPNNSDSDNDSLSDDDEINTFNTNPNNADSDNDGLSDSDEVNTYQSNPNSADTSNDGLSDQALIDYGLDPNVDHSLLSNAIVQSISDLRAGSTIIEVTNNQATITLNLESSDDLLSWAGTGDTATLQIPTSSDTQFYRFKLSD